VTSDAPSPRAALADIAAYIPGKPPVARPGLTTYKLSSNENPYPPLDGVMEAATKAASVMNRYPDMGCAGLYAALADKLGVPADNLAAGTGSVAVLYHLLQAYCNPGDEVVYAWRSFEAYPIAVTVSGAVSVQVPLTTDARHDLDAMAAAVTDRTKAVIVCTPNNPTGPSVTHTEMAAFLEKIPSRVLVVIDEAYQEFVRQADRIDALLLSRAIQRGGDADVRQGLRAGRPSGRVRRRARADRRLDQGVRAALRGLDDCSGRRDRQSRA
jgi:histidinol-phosphate aminotransferase